MCKAKGTFLVKYFMLLNLFFVAACENSLELDSTVNDATKEVSVPGRDEQSDSYFSKVKIKTNDDKDALIVKLYDDKIKLEFSGRIFEGKSNDSEKRKYFEENGSQVCEVKAKDSDGFKLRTPDGKLLWKVKFTDKKIKISDNEEVLNAFELVKKEDGAKIERNEVKLGKVKYYKDRKKVKVKNASDEELFDVNTDMYSVSYGIVLFEEIPIEFRYIIIAELLSRKL